MAQILDLGNVVGPAGPNEITENTETNLTGVLIGAGGKVTAVIPSADTLGVVAKTGDTMTGALTVPEVSVLGVCRENMASSAGGDANTCLTVVNNPSNAYGVTEHHDVFLGASGLAYAVPLICGLRLRTEASSLTDYGTFYVTPEAVQAVTPGENPEELTTFDGNMYLGSSGKKWTAVWATTGTIQTSDRAAKDDIRYLVDESAPMVLSLTDEDTDPTTPAAVTVGDVMDFVRNLAPVTFCYKNGAESASEETAQPESIQLGLIADEIENHPLFKYVGVKTESGLGLQAIPLATVALTACKKLTEELDSVTARLAALEMKMETILSEEEA